MDETTVFKDLSDPTRINILDSIKNGTKCICEIIPYTGKSQPNVSHHIKILKNAGLISEEKDGTNVLIKLSNKDVFKVIEMVRRLK